jgi:alpha-mannosidase
MCRGSGKVKVVNVLPEKRPQEFVRVAQVVDKKRRVIGEWMNEWLKLFVGSKPFLYPFRWGDIYLSLAKG